MIFAFQPFRFRWPSEASKWPQDGPRSLQDAPRGLQEPCQEVPKRQTSLISFRCLKDFGILAVSASRRSKTAQEASKIAPRPPKRPPRGPKTAQERPKTAQKGPHRTPETGEAIIVDVRNALAASFRPF